jgi:S-formylglutathione hydrolase FrmB
MKTLKLRSFFLLIVFLLTSVTFSQASTFAIPQNDDSEVIISEEQPQADTIAVPSAKMGRSIKCTIIVPVQYFDDTSSRFPVVYLLHGYSGDYKSWSDITKPNIGDVSSQYGMIFVCPDGQDSWYWDSPIDPKMQFETFMTTELVPYIDSHYRTLADSAHRAITGLSMGGHGSLWLGFRHPNLFGSCGSMSGGVDIVPFPEKWKMKERLGDEATNMDVWRSHSVAGLVPTLKNIGQNVIFDCGTEDEYFVKVNAELHQALLKQGIPHDYIERPGRHNHAYWSNSLDYQLLFFDKAFKKATSKEEQQ